MLMEHSGTAASRVRRTLAAMTVVPAVLTITIVATMCSGSQGIDSVGTKARTTGFAASSSVAGGRRAKRGAPFGGHAGWSDSFRSSSSRGLLLGPEQCSTAFMTSFSQELAGAGIMEGIEYDGVAEAQQQQQQQQQQRDATKTALLGAFGEIALNGHRRDPVLVCPSTLGELTDVFRSYGAVGPVSVYYKATPKRPGVRYRKRDFFTDFVEETRPSQTDAVMEGTFQRPLVSWLYERGWRQGFNVNGFPGIDEEFVQVKKFLADNGGDGGTVIDLSCGSGLMMRRLVASKRYGRVIGGDLSASMLTETAKRFRENDLEKPELIRCDASKLPLRTESVDGVHAGAALHCWTRLEESIAEVYRVLKPGKGFFATTFLNKAALDRAQKGQGFKFFELDELERLMRDAGFAQVQVSQSGRACAIVRAVK
ncbi:unnamed protein product [Ascophyllum nodosum]